MSSALVPVIVTEEATVHPPAFDAFFVAHVAMLVRSLTVVCGDRETAADCVQEAFLRAHQRWSRVSGYDDPVGWVRRVALNLAHDVHRRGVRARAAHHRLAGWARAGATAPAADATLPDDPLAAALGSLPPRQRAVLAFHYIEGLTVAEIARSLKISDGAVKFHLHAGRERLRPLLAGDAS